MTPRDTSHVHDAFVERAIGAHASKTGPDMDVAEALVEFAARAGAQLAFGVVGGPVLPIVEALCAHPAIRCVPFALEATAGYAAVEASIASDRLVVCFATTGPGVVGMQPGLAPARPEGAKILLLSATTRPGDRFSGDVQGTDQLNPVHRLGADGSIFDLSVELDHVADVPALLARLACEIVDRPDGFVAHVAVSPHVMRELAPAEVPDPCALSVALPAPSRRTADVVAERLRTFSTVVWVGWGARHHQPAVLALLEGAALPAMVTPRGIGIVPEDHPSFVGMSGMFDSRGVGRRLDDLGIEQTLVLGSTLGRPSRGQGTGLSRAQGFIHVDVDRTAGAASFPAARRLVVQADIGEFLKALEPFDRLRRPHPPLRSAS
jgi:acetolactate synthase-1/2/3 large subunit